MLLDANLLLYAVDRSSPFHERSAAWLTEVLNGARRVGLPWPSLLAFLRISTHPRASARPLAPSEAWRFVDDWLTAGPAWIPAATERHASVLADLMVSGDLRGNLAADAHLAALAIEHGLTVCSADSDFARFPKITWENPLQR